MRIGLFGAYHPEYRRSGSVTTSLSVLLSELEEVDRVVVFAQAGASLPAVPMARPPEVVPAWRFDDPGSLVAAAVRMLGASRRLDAFLFNIYLTSFGARRVSNAVGLLIAPFLALLSRRPVVVYMHNLLETQDVRALGYAPGRATRLLLRVIEYALLRLTDVVVPLRDQATTIARHFSVGATPLFLPYMDAAYLSLAQVAAAPSSPPPAPELGAPEGPGILLFGAWGPQKDLPGALKALHELRASGLRFRVTVAGAANVGFPEFADVLDRLEQQYRPDGFAFRGTVPDERLLELFAQHQVLVLPYAATGGQSGVMNLGTLARQTVVAYDSPQLRETAELLGTEVEFVPAGDREALLAALRRAVLRAGERGPCAPDLSRALAAARRGVLELYARLRYPTDVGT